MSLAASDLVKRGHGNGSDLGALEGRKLFVAGLTFTTTDDMFKNYMSQVRSGTAVFARTPCFSDRVFLLSLARSKIASS